MSVIPTEMQSSLEDKFADFESALESEDYGLAREVIESVREWGEMVVARMDKMLAKAQK